jgi:hypothetical protein
MRCEPVDDVFFGRALGPACVQCGCTEARACPGGCHWISEDPPVCSACNLPDGGAFSAQRCPASPTAALHVLLWIDAISGYCARCGEGFMT